MGIFDRFKKSDHIPTSGATKQLTAEDLFEQGKAYQALSPDKAFQCYLQAAEMGYAIAMGQVGICYLHQGHGVECSTEKAAYWFEKGANAGNARCMTLISAFYMAGVAREQNDDIARDWLQKAIETGDENAIATANKRLNDYEMQKITWNAILNGAEEMGGIPPK